MKRDTLNYIKRLSLADKKTLSQKGLKLVEEVGELARVILPYDGAPGTIHRFVDQEAILEEAVDSILTAISIPFQLGFSIEEIEDMMIKKSGKWRGIQMKEEKLEDKFAGGDIPYEIHVTFQIAPDEVEKFQDACENIGVKPIVIELENQGDVVMQDVMTSSTVIGNNATAIMHAKEIEMYMKRDFGFTSTRTKIETIPWHPMAPQSPGEKMPGDCYFEAHVGCVVTSPEDKEFLLHLAEETESHLSRNAFKKLDNGNYINMITLRDTQNCLEEFEVNLKNLTDWLDRQGIDYSKVIREFAVYDTNINHDFLWTQKKEATAQ